MKKLSHEKIILILFIFFLFSNFCMSADIPLSLTDITSWAYQIQDLSENGAVDSLINSNYDMLVLEPTRTDWSSDDRDFNTRDMVTQLKNSKAGDGIHRKLVIAYIDIGEAEDWRWYWNWSKDWDCIPPTPADWPDFILTCDPDDWAGNYPVAYWDSLWKDIIIYGNNQNSDPFGDYTSVLDEVIKDGFDGIYLDWVEAFEDEDVIAAAQADGKDPAVEMVTFIQEMKQYAINRNPDFLVIQQNAVSLCDDHPELFNIIDAISQEAVRFDGDATDDWNDPTGYDWKNEVSLVDYYLEYLEEYINAGVPVFNCEYALNYALTAYSKSIARGFIPYVSQRSLARLTSTPPPGYGTVSMDLSSVKSFLYQLQELDFKAVGETFFDLVIMDYSLGGEEEGEYTAVQIDSVRQRSDGERIILSYMSIGEAEDYRFYWKDGWKPGKPSWLGPENPDWGGNYKVKFWEQGWQDIIFSYTDRILDAGFDGVYLDIIDAYDYYIDDRSTSAQDMADFVAAIAVYARTKDPDFLIFPQNAPELAEMVPGYLNTVNGIGQEDIYYGYDEDGIATPSDVTAELESYLNLFRDDGKLVLTTDYPFSQSEDEPHFDNETLTKIDNAYSQSKANGYVPYCTIRNLNYLTINPGYEPTKVIDHINFNFPLKFKLLPNFPNPFNPHTNIEYSVIGNGLPVNIALKVYNILGKEVITLVDNTIIKAGLYSVTWDGMDKNGCRVSSDTYLVQLIANEYVETRKIVILK
jgi:cysteinyl-tRNA synthetase